MQRIADLHKHRMPLRRETVGVLKTPGQWVGMETDRFEEVLFTSFGRPITYRPTETESHLNNSSC